MTNPSQSRRKTSEVGLAPGVVGLRSFTVSNHEPVTATIHVAEFAFDEQAGRYLCTRFTVVPDPTTKPPNTEGVTTEAVRLATTSKGWGILGRLRLAFGTRVADQGDPLRELPNPRGVEPWGLRVPREFVAAHKREPGPRLDAWVLHLLVIGERLYGEPVAYLRDALQCSMGTASRLAQQAGGQR